MQDTVTKILPPARWLCLMICRLIAFLLSYSMTNLNPAYFLRKARSKAGLTQRELAKRAGTAQSVIARIELGKTDPSTTTLNTLLASAGFELQSELVVRPVENSHMLKDVERILQLSPEERLEELKAANEFLTGAQHV